MNKKGILVVSFGTTHIDTRVKTIEAIENAIKNEFLDYSVYRAFTSNMVIKYILKQECLYIMNIEEAIMQMIEDGIEEIIVQPTHVISGFETDKLVEIAKKYKEKFKKFAIGKPLLYENKDYQQACKIIMDEVEKLSVPNNDNYAFILMGHGTKHDANSCYSNLQTELKIQQCKNIFVATVEGTPDIADIIEYIKKYRYNTVILMPFMIVAGEHAKNDMASDEEKSWKSLLENEGYEVNCILKGLGEIKEIQHMIIDHVKDVM